MYQLINKFMTILLNQIKTYFLFDHSARCVICFWYLCRPTSVGKALSFTVMMNASSVVNQHRAWLVRDGW